MARAMRRSKGNGTRADGPQREIKLPKWATPERVAHHEAGHAVASHLLGLRFREVTIVPNQQVGALGLIVTRTWSEVVRFAEVCDDPTPAARRRLEHDIIVYFAGPAAEQHFAGTRNTTGARSDFAAASMLAERVCGSAESTTAYLKWLQIRARELITSARSWRAVKALAQALVRERRLRAKEAREIIEEAVRGTTRRQHAALLEAARNAVLLVPDTEG